MTWSSSEHRHWVPRTCILIEGEREKGEGEREKMNKERKREEEEI